MDCLLPAALSGALSLPAPDLDHPPPPGPGKGILGETPQDHLTTDNFLIGWDDAGDEDDAVAAGEALEAGWTALVEEQGWAPPVSSEDHLIRVLLYPLGGTGVTTEVQSALYPEGVPVIYVNPDYADNAPFWEHLLVHEFAHALQFKQRDTWSSTSSEAWYWEASAEWQVEQALPDLDVVAWQSSYYAWQTQLRFDSTEGAHQYGMFVLNAWLEQAVWGPEGLREVWESSGGGESWPTLIGDLPALWPDFTHAYGNRLLEDSSLYEPVIPTTLKDGSSGTLPLLGTHYLLAGADSHVRAEGPVVLSADRVVEGQVLAVSGLEDDASYTLELYEPGDTGDTAMEDTAVLPGDEPVLIRTARCGCAGTHGAPLLIVLLSALAARSRRGDGAGRAP